jgi:hypothetical protein
MIFHKVLGTTKGISQAKQAKQPDLIGALAVAPEIHAIIVIKDRKKSAAGAHADDSDLSYDCINIKGCGTDIC